MMDNGEVITAATPTELGTALVAAIEAEPRTDVQVVYMLIGPVSRRLAPGATA
jgi:hypothetical protein